MAELHVSKKSIGKLFSEMQDGTQEKKFVIPDFQRPYKWDDEKCETLWNNIVEFSTTDAKKGSDYFLGSIVFYSNDEGNLEIIDGQQRIISFFLMLRAFYRKLEDMKNQDDEDVVGLKSQLAPCLWDISPISRKVSDQTKIHIESLVATEEDNDTFHKILETGEYNKEAKDNYSTNYRFFKKRCDDYAENEPMQWKELCVTILKKCIVLPIECNTPETALTIFNTLNDRGLPLADSDIFKAQIYRNTPEGMRKEFAETWRELTEVCREAGITIDEIFRYYTHVLRARSGDKSKEIGLRKFYAEKEYERLKSNCLMEEIISLADFWFYVNTGSEPNEEDGYSFSLETRQFFHCLSHYPNEFWKYVVSVYFIKNKENRTFDDGLSTILKKLVAFLFVKYIEKPSVNAIKDDIYGICISVQTNNELQTKNIFDVASISQQMDKLTSSSKILKPLLLLEAYLNPHQKSIIPKNFELEHIFPTKWQNTNYNGWSHEEAEQYLEYIGNRIVLEKKLNILAGNGYFGRKKEKYCKSSIACVRDLGDHPKTNWSKEDIETRQLAIKNKLFRFFSEQLETISATE